MSRGKRDAARAVVEAFGDTIQGADAGPALVRVIAELRPYLRDAMREAGVPSGAPESKRLSDYTVALKIWEGVNSNDVELVGEADPETVRGFDELAAYLVECLADFHDDKSSEELAQAGISCAALAPRLPGLRSMLSRAGGQTTLRVPYDLDGIGYLATAPIKRAD